MGFPTWLHFSPLPSSLMEISSQYRDSQLRAPGWTFASPSCLPSFLGVVPHQIAGSESLQGFFLGMCYFRFTIDSVWLLASLKMNKEYVCTLVSLVKEVFYMVAWYMQCGGVLGGPFSVAAEGGFRSCPCQASAAGRACSGGASLEC